MCPVYVCICKLVRVAKGQVYVRLCCEMEDGVDVVFTEDMLDGGWGGDVAVFKSEVGIGFEASGVVEGCAVGEVVQ
jgi:hypothetical protein